MTGTPAPETIALPRTATGGVDRRPTLTAFADGQHIEPVFGPDRAVVAASLATILRGIMPSEDDLIKNAYGYGDERRIRAYRNGCEHLVTAYGEYADSHNLPHV